LYCEYSRKIYQSLHSWPKWLRYYLPKPNGRSVIVYVKLAKAGKKAGEPHAEVNAVNAVKDKSLLKKRRFTSV
jgi:hypothetical protein